MKVIVNITVQRDDGTVLTRGESVDQRTARYYTDGWTKRETKSELRKRVDSVLTAALNSTMGR